MEKTWSKTKKKLESFLADSLKGRVSFQVTRYRNASDQTGRAVILVDKQEVFNMCTILSERAVYTTEMEIRERLDVDEERIASLKGRELEAHIEKLIDTAMEIQNDAYWVVKNDGIYSKYDFFQAVDEYLNQPIADSLNSDELLIRILALLDRRVGKRTLQKLEAGMEQEHDLVKQFYRLRCEAEKQVLLKGDE